MHLWTEYEGNTLAGYTVGRLSRSEGRSAFFQTVAEGQPALLRLTESHFDETELTGRWKKIAAVSHPNLQAILQSGQTTFDGVALAFCLLEPTDANLSEVLRERVLSTEETADVAEAVARGLSALHAAGLIHEHVDATNVFAQGEVVKLRSDCARECTGDFEADTAEAREALRQRDVHDLGLLIRRCLTPQWEESSAVQLPSPFDRIVRRALNGTVSAAGIVAEFEALKPAPVAAAVTPNAAVPLARPIPVAEVAQAREALRGIAERGAGTPPKVGVYTPARAAAPSVAHSPDAVSAALGNGADALSGRRPVGDDDLGRAGFRAKAAPGLRGSPDVRLDRVRNRSRYQAGVRSLGVGVLEGLRPLAVQIARRKAWVAAGAAVAVLGGAVWSTTGGARDASAGSNAAHESARLGARAEAVPEKVVVQPSSARDANRQGASDSLLATGEQAGWHVIAYTYRYEKQAEAKAVQLKRRYDSLQPQVFSPTGRAPYFVALGGPSDSVSAIALRNRARRAGLPRDTYARNF